MQAEKIAKYLTELRNKTGLSYEAISEISKRPESTVKNLCTGKTEDPRLDTVAPVIYAMGGSLDEMYNPEKNKDEMKETSVVALKEIYEFQIATMKETNEIHINNIRTHYGQHHEDLKENFDNRIADKQVIIDIFAQEIQKLNTQLEKKEEERKTGNLIRNIIIGALGSIPIILFILEIMHPEHGWLRY